MITEYNDSLGNLYEHHGIDTYTAARFRTRTLQPGWEIANAGHPKIRRNNLFFTRIIMESMEKIGMEKYGKFIDRAKKLGADDAKIIKTDSIVTAAWVRWKCHYGCDMYGSSLCCPPNSPNYLETREVIKCYENALLIHYKKGFQSKTHPTEIAVTLEKELFFAGYYKAFALGEGPCLLCEQCAKGQCVYPGDARPSMESCGIDVFSTVRNNGFSIQVLKKDYEEIMAEKSPKVNRFGMVLIE